MQAQEGKNAQMLEHKELNREALTRCNCLEIELSSWPISTQVRKTGLPMSKRKIDVVLWPKMKINQATTNVSRERRNSLESIRAPSTLMRCRPEAAAHSKERREAAEYAHACTNQSSHPPHHSPSNPTEPPLARPSSPHC